MNSFISPTGFCSICGTIFPKLHGISKVTCYNCKTDFKLEDLDIHEVEYIIYFNSYDSDKKSGNKDPKGEVSEGPIVDRKCSKCSHDKMSYMTLQLRSADEGQTVFFTCLKCKNKESENS